METTTKEVPQDRGVLRHRVKQLADEQHALQKVLHELPRWKVREHVELMEQHAIELSRLARRLYDEPHEVGKDNGRAPEGHQAESHFIAPH